MLEEETTPAPQKKKVLIISKHAYIIESTKKVLSSLELECDALLEETEDLTEKILHFNYDLLLIVGNVDPHLVDDLCGLSERNKPTAKVLIHRGGPATIPAEVSEILGKQ